MTFASFQNGAGEPPVYRSVKVCGAGGLASQVTRSKFSRPPQQTINQIRFGLDYPPVYSGGWKVSVSATEFSAHFSGSGWFTSIMKYCAATRSPLLLKVIVPVMPG